MKHKDSMRPLRRKMVVYFLAITGALGILNSLLESAMQFVLDKAETLPVEGASSFLTSAFLSARLMCYILGGLVFFALTEKALRKESARRVEEQNLLYAAIAHDLKTPMTSVQGFAKALAEDRVPEEERAEVCGIIYRKSQSMNELVNTLFEYAKFGTEAYKPELAETDLCILVRDLIAEHYCDFEEQGMEPEFDIPEEPVLRSADSQELKRALGNLLVNTYKHNPAGTNVFVSVQQEGDAAVIAIADSGNAIPAGMDIFEPFVTENTARTPGHGTGLGLAVTKRVIERHQGSISLVPGWKGYTKAFLVKL